MTTTKKTASVRLDETKHSRLEEKAAEKGMTKNSYIESLLDEVLNDGSQKSETLDNTDENKNQIVATLSKEDKLHIANLVAKVVEDSTKNSSANLFIVSPEREFLRKIVGKDPELETSLSQEEETYLQNLSAAIKADAIDELLLDHNSVPLPQMSPVQARMYKQMIAKREEVISEKLPALTKVFQNAIAEAFYQDCERLYGKNLFKATYGFDFSEFKAVFVED